MTKAVVINGGPTNWRINGVADCAGRIMGEVIGVRWLLGERRREGKAASSVVVYLQNEVREEALCCRVPMESLDSISWLEGGFLFWCGRVVLSEVHLRFGLC